MSSLLRNVLVCTAVVLSGCKSLPSRSQQPAAPELAFTATDRPVFSAAYYPYGVCMPRHLAAPIPNYNNWTASRMSRDLQRIQEAGFDEVLVCLSTDIANDKFGLSRVIEFIDETARLGGLKVALFVESGKTPLRRDLLAERLVGARVHAGVAVLQEAGRPVVFVQDGVETMGASHPAIFFHTVKKSDWFWAASGALSGDVLVREDGRLLQRSIWQAYRQKARRIAIAWNDFHSGNFVEPNSHDSDAGVAMLTVRTETRRVADSVLASRRAAGALPAQPGDLTLE